MYGSLVWKLFRRKHRMAHSGTTRKSNPKGKRRKPLTYNIRAQADRQELTGMGTACTCTCYYMYVPSTHIVY